MPLTQYSLADLPPSRDIRVQQIASPARRHHSQRETLIGLGLSKIGSTRDLPNNPMTIGRIKKVAHLVRILDPDKPLTFKVKTWRKRGDAATTAKPYPPSDVAKRLTGWNERPVERSPRSGPKLVKRLTGSGEKFATELRELPMLLESDTLSLLQIVSGLRSNEPETKIGALLEAAKAIREIRRRAPMKSHERVELANLPRRAYASLFDPDERVALQAAYTLVASSKSGSKKYKPEAFTELSKEQIDNLRQDLPKLLHKLGDRFYSSVELLNVNRSDKGVEAKVRITYTRRLPFEIGHRPVLLPEPKSTPRWDADLQVSSFPDAKINVEEVRGRDDPKWREGDLFVANCSIHLSAEVGPIKSLTVAYTVDGDVTREVVRLDKS